MIRSIQLKTPGLTRPSLQLTPLLGTVPATTRAASLSAIHRGLRRSERAEYGEARPRPVSRRGMENLNDDISRTRKALDGAGSKRGQRKLVKKLEKKEAKRDGTGPQSRRKRFNDPDSEHGKQSLVYHAKHGVLKDMVDKLDKPVEARLLPTTARGVRRREREDLAAKGDRVSSNDFKQRMLDGQKAPAPRAGAAFDSKFEAKRTDAPAPERRDTGGRGRSAVRRDERRGRSEARYEERKAQPEAQRDERREQPEGRRDDRRDRTPQVPAFKENGEPELRKDRRARFWEAAQAKEQEQEERRLERPRSSPPVEEHRRQERGQGSYPARDDRRVERTRSSPPVEEHRRQEREQGGFSARDDRRQDRGQRNFSAREEGSLDISAPAPRERSHANMLPLTIKYTTAASQFLYGRAVVRSAFEQARRKLYRLYVYAGENRQEMGDVNDLTRLAKKHSVPITIVPKEDQRLMDKMSQGRPHNGFVLETSPIPQKPVRALGEVEESASRNGFHVTLDRQSTEEAEVNGTDTFIRRARGETSKPFVLLIDEIMDPGNLGAMLRTASYLGVDAVGITNRNTSRLTPVVLKSAAGAVEEISIFSVDSPAKFLQESRKAGWRSYAAVPPPNGKLARLHRDKFISTEKIEYQSPLSKHPCIVVLGNEGFGLSKQVKVAADYEVSVPRYVHHSCVDSLNVSVATGLLCHSFVKKAVEVDEGSLAEELPEPEEEEEEEEASSKPVGSVMF